MSEPASQNPYMYCKGNPVKYSDPSGYQGISAPGGPFDPDYNFHPIPAEGPAPREGVIDTSADHIFGAAAILTGIMRGGFKVFSPGKGLEKASSTDQIFKNPKILNNMTEDEVRALGKKELLEIGTLNRGHAKGTGLRIRDAENDRTIYHEPGGGRHGPEPYWKLTQGGNGGTTRIGPQFPEIP